MEDFDNSRDKVEDSNNSHNREDDLSRDFRNQNRDFKKCVEEGKVEQLA